MIALARFFALAAMLLLAVPTARGADLDNTIYLDVPAGRVVIEMRPDLAPHHVARIKALVQRGFYNGLKFHRVIAGFMAQTGDPQGNGTGGSGQTLDAEFSKEHHVRGTLSMARSSNPNSADSQFFICLAAAPFLDGKYTIWGQVVSGMEFVDAIKKGDKDDNGAVTNPDQIVKMQIASDAEKKK
jgi:peptidylprolyl isomerase